MNRRLLYPLIGVGILSVGWGGFELYHIPRVLPGVLAAEVPVGGLTVSEATSRLAERRAAVPVIRVRAGDQVMNLNATELGWRPDYAATAKNAFQIGREGAPLENLGKRFGGDKTVSLTARVDPKTFRNRLESLAKPFNVAPKNAAIVFASGQYVVRADSSGRGLNFEAAVRQFQENPDLRELTLSITDIPATTKTADLEPLAAQANAVLRPLTLQYTPLGTDKSFTRTLSTTEVANLFFVERNGLRVDEKAVTAMLARVAAAYDREPLNARYVKGAGGALSKRPSRDGYKLDSSVARTLLMDEVLRPEASSVMLPVIVSKAQIPDEALPQTKDLKVLASATTRYGGSSRERVLNAAIAASKLDGYVVPAGDEFSFNEGVGPIEESTGFVAGYVISGGRTIKGVGGGVCQASTTAFNALYRAGLPVTERNQHSYRVRWYDDVFGLDAAVYYGALDLRFRNDTPGPLLIRASSRGASMTVQVYGVSDGRKVSISKTRILSSTPAPPPAYEFVASLPPGTRKQVDWAVGGMRTTATRTVTKGDQRLSDTIFNNYRPWRAVYQIGPTRVKPANNVARQPRAKPANAAVIRTSSR
jgi:vancomycin resistance protein YoaR